jgi:hypothetical protein
MSFDTRDAGGATAYTRSSGYSSIRSIGEIGSSESEIRQFHSRGWTTTIDELHRIRNLEDDWDGEGTNAPHPAVVDRAISLALTLKSNGEMPPDRVFASVNSTVYFEWHTVVGYREIEVRSPVDVESRFVRAGSKTTEVVSLSR